MTAKRILTVTALSAFIGCTAISCGEIDFGETLRWRSAVEIPINHLHKLGNDLWNENYDGKDGGEGGVFLHLGVDTISIASDAMDIVKKLDAPEISYRISIANNTSVKLTLYGLLFPENDGGAATMGLTEFYGLDAPSAPIDNRINLMGTGGLTIGSWGDTTMSMPKSQGPPLRDLILHYKAVSWRWLAMVEAGEERNLSDTASTTEHISVRLVIRAEGVNSFDSLFTINGPRRAGIDAFISSRGSALP